MNWKNIFSPIYERAKSPLYGSFIVSWLIWNWRIVFVVLFISKYNLGSLNLDQYILCNYWNPKDGFVIPLGLACIYLFLLPWIDNWIAIYRAQAKKKREEAEIAINRTSREVSGEEHYQLNLKYIAERNRVLDFEKDLGAEKLKARELENELSGLEESFKKMSQNNQENMAKVDELKKENIRLYNRHAIPSSFQGRWIYTQTSNDRPQEPQKMDIEIQGDKIYIVSNDGTKTSKYVLRLIDWDEPAKALSFVKQDMGTGQNFIQILKYVNRLRFDGMEDGKLNVGYIKEE